MLGGRPASAAALRGIPPGPSLGQLLEAASFCLCSCTGGLLAFAVLFVGMLIFG